MEQEVKDNPIYDKYEKDRSRWEKWPGEDRASFQAWKMPDKLEDAKSLSYNIYRIMAEQHDNGDRISSYLYPQVHYTETIDKVNNGFLGYFTLALEEIIFANPEIDLAEPRKVSGKTAFIIHGHDNDLKREVELLLTDAGVNHIVLNEQPDRGRAIIDKMLDETKYSGYAIALLTPDDITEHGDKRARQNVIFEIGYFLGRIGKERIRMIVKDNIEIPSDLGGILYEKYDSKGAWKIKLLKEMQAVGIYVDIQNAIERF